MYTHIYDSLRPRLSGDAGGGLKELRYKRGLLEPISCVYTYKCIYIYREREINMCIYIYIYMYIYYSY